MAELGKIGVDVRRTPDLNVFMTTLAAAIIVGSFLGLLYTSWQRKEEDSSYESVCLDAHEFLVYDGNIVQNVDDDGAPVPCSEETNK